jgi:S-adenosylmethionine/arginine decarboxylase-like enzyme
MIKIVPLKPSEIKTLQDRATLYTSDFRSISESMEFDIPAMRKYENLVPWILSSGATAATNPEGKQLQYPNHCNLVTVQSSSDPKLSIYNRLLKRQLPKGITQLWAAIPHPDADRLASQKQLKLNYSYADFLRRNDKFTQKKLLGNTSPRWEVVRSLDEITNKLTAYRNGYIKRRHGSGGFTVFPVKSVLRDQQFRELFDSGDDGEWYIEERAIGQPCSIQVLREADGTTTIFGYAEQLISNGRYFAGLRMRPLKSLTAKMVRALTKVIQRLEPLLDGYVGFFGIDFMLSSKGIQILESNVRLTAATIPILLVNKAGTTLARYYEDLPLVKCSSDDTVLTFSTEEKQVDIIRWELSRGTLGKYVALECRDCGYLPSQIDQATVEKLKHIVVDIVSNVEESAYHNFWPFGWTVSFILSDSHCIMSSWYMEKKVLIDIYSCRKTYDHAAVARLLKRYFQAGSCIIHSVANR